MIAWCHEHHLPLHVFDWRPAFESGWPGRNGFYLLRAGYVCGDCRQLCPDPKVIDGTSGITGSDRVFRQFLEHENQMSDGLLAMAAVSVDINVE